MKQAIRGAAMLLLFGMAIALKILYQRGLLSFELTVGMVSVVLVGVIAFDHVENGWGRRLKKVMKRLQQNEDHAVLKEYQRRRARGDKSFTTTIILSAVNMRLGQGATAEQLAREAWVTAEQSGELKGPGQGARIRREVATIAVYDAIAVQGRFSEAAQGLLDHLPDALDKSEFAAFSAWYFFMGRQDDQVRRILQTYFPQPQPGWFHVNLKSEQYQFIIFYLAHKVLGRDTRNSLLQLQPQLVRLEGEAKLAGSSPYAARLYDILRDMSYVMGLSGDVIRPIV